MQSTATSAAMSSHVESFERALRGSLATLMVLMANFSPVALWVPAPAAPHTNHRTEPGTQGQGTEAKVLPTSLEGVSGGLGVGKCFSLVVLSAAGVSTHSLAPVEHAEASARRELRHWAESIDGSPSAIERNPSVEQNSSQRHVCTYEALLCSWRCSCLKLYKMMYTSSTCVQLLVTC